MKLDRGFKLSQTFTTQIIVALVLFSLVFAVFPHELKLPKNFSATFSVVSRPSILEGSNAARLKGVMTKRSNWDIGAIVSYSGDVPLIDENFFRTEKDIKRDDRFFYYRSGRLFGLGGCINEVSSIPSVNTLNDLIISTAIRIDPHSPIEESNSSSNANQYQDKRDATTTTTTRRRRKRQIFDKEVNQCISMKENVELWSIEYEYERWVICTEKSHSNHDIPFRIISSHTIVDIGDFQENEINEWVMHFTEDAMQCKQNLHYGSLKTLEHQLRYQLKHDDLLWFFMANESCTLDWIRDNEECSKYEQIVTRTLSDTQDSAATNGQKICIFLHGAAQSAGQNEREDEVFRGYWGNVDRYTPQCSKRYFIREETKQRGWDNEDLQKSFCRLALSEQPSTDRVIRNKVIFSHSMGSLILAAAIKSGKCDVDSRTTGWYALQSPFLGSKAADELQRVCSGNDWIIRFAANWLGFCVNEGGTQQAIGSFRSLKTVRMNELRELSVIAMNKMKGCMCGTDPSGINSQMSNKLAMLDRFIAFDEDSDGVVPLTSCMGSFPRHSFQHTYRENFYLLRGNHYDGTCKNGDGTVGADRMPCSFFTNKL